MSRALLAAVLVAAGASPAAADPHSALVLRTDGGADAPTRARVDALVLRLAKQAGLTASAGDITFADAAAATGCNPDTPACRDDVVTMLSVDEIVSATTYVSAGDLKVVVRRGAKGAPPREATATIAMADGSDAALEAGLGPLFDITPAATPPPPVTPTTPAITQPPPVTATVTEPAPAPTQPPAQPGVTAAPAGQVVVEPQTDQLSPHHRLELGGAIVGGASVVLGFLLWGAAKSTENQIQMAPTATSADLQHLRDLETQGDGQANGGNFFFVTGLVVGGISSYYLYRDHKRARAAQHARITPMVVDHGAGLSLTFGGSP